MQTRVALLAAVAAVGLLAMPDGALAQRRAFVVDNVLWLPDVFTALNAQEKQKVQTERRNENRIFKKVQRALTRKNFDALTRSELEQILSYSTSDPDLDLNLTPDGSDRPAYAGLDRMIGVDLGSTGSTTFRIDLSQNFLPTLRLPTVESGVPDPGGYRPLDEVYSIARVRRGTGGVKIAKNGITFDKNTGILEVKLKKPLADKQFVKLLFELEDGSRSPKGGKRAARSKSPSFQVTIANVSLPTADADPIVVEGTVIGDKIISQASAVEAAVTTPGRSGYRHFLLRDAARAFPNDPNGAEIEAGGTVSDDDDGYTAIVTNGVLFNRFNVAVQLASPS